MESTKTEAEHKLGALKFLLQSVTSLSTLIASLMIVAGVTGYGHFHSWSSFLQPGHQLMLSPSMMVTVLGALLMVVSLCGLVGAWIQSYCLVNSYALILILILLVQLVAVVLAFSTLDADTLSNFVSIPVWDYVNDKELEVEIDILQRELKCCGCNSYMDYLGVIYTDAHNVMLVDDLVLVPASCCSYGFTATVCEAVYLGCNSVFVDIVQRNLYSIGVLGVSVIFVQLLAVMLALLLGHSIRKLTLQRALLEWTMKEQTLYMQHELEYNSL